MPYSVSNVMWCWWLSNCFFKEFFIFSPRRSEQANPKFCRSISPRVIQFISIKSRWYDSYHMSHMRVLMTVFRCWRQKIGRWFLSLTAMDPYSKATVTLVTFRFCWHKVGDSFGLIKILPLGFWLRLFATKLVTNCFILQHPSPILMLPTVVSVMLVTSMFGDILEMENLLVNIRNFHITVIFFKCFSHFVSWSFW